MRLAHSIEAKIMVPLAVVLVVVIWVAVRTPDQTALPPLLNPNGYDDFVAAGRMLQGEWRNYWEWTDSQRKTYWESNQLALAKLREGLAKKSRIPLEFNPQFFTRHAGTISANNSLLVNLKIEAVVATAEGRMSDAVDASLDCLRFGNASAEGGLMIDAMLGLSKRSSGAEYLLTTLTNYDATLCHQIAAEAALVDSGVEPIAAILERDRRWEREVNSLGERVREAYESLTTGRQLTAMFEKSYQREQRQLRQLILAAAARAYELEKGRPPQNAGELVPDYLKAVPRDPTTGTNLTLVP
jgi:hypothetical protein